MKQIKKIAGILGMTILVSNCLAQTNQQKTSGIVLRGAFWATESDGCEITVTDDYFNNTTVDIGNFGGWITFFSRLGDQTYLECSIGTVGQVKTKSHSFDSENVRVKGIVPLLFGMRYNLLPMKSSSAIQPYISGGGGPYWQCNVSVVDQWFEEEEVNIKNKLQPGFYLGCGTYFQTASWFTLNFDMKYHLIGFDFDDDFSGFEFGMGFGFLWGNY